MLIFTWTVGGGFSIWKDSVGWIAGPEWLPKVFLREVPGLFFTL